MSDYSEGLLSPHLRQRRVKMALPFVGGNVLDFGCGVGGLTSHIDCKSYLGVDVDHASIRIAQKKNPDHKFLIIEKGEDIAPIREFCPSFDTIVSLAVIEHVKDQAVFLKRFVSLLASGGKIVLTTPHPTARAIHEAGSLVGIFSRYGAEEHETFLDKRDIFKLADETGLRVTHFKHFQLLLNQLIVMEKC